MAQFQSPIGKWVLAEHVITGKVDSNSTNNPGETNIYRHQLEAFIIFDSSGFCVKSIGDYSTAGKWKLRKKNRKLTITLNDGSKFNLFSSSPLNFHNPLFIQEELKVLYDPEWYVPFGGESKYVREILESQKVDSSKLIGKWTVSFIQIGKRTKEYSGSWMYEIVREPKSESISGTWILSSSDLSLDQVIINEDWNPLQVDYFMEEIEGDKFLLIGTSEKKIERVHLIRIQD